MVGEHLPIKYNSELIKDRFYYNFIINTLKHLPTNKKINIVLEVGIKESEYNFHQEMLSSRDVLKSFLEES